MDGWLALACHNTMSSYELRGRRGTNVGGGLDSAMCREKTLVQNAARSSGDHSSPSSLTVWRYVKRTTVRARGQSQSPITPSRLKPPEKKGCHLFRCHSHQTRSWTRSNKIAAKGRWSCWVKRTDECSLPLWWRRGTRALSRHELACHWLLKFSIRYFFSQITGRKKTGGHEGRSRSLKRKLTASAERQDWNTLSASIPQMWHTLSVSIISVQGIPVRLTMTARHLQQRCAEIYSSSKAFLYLTG